MPRKKEQGQTTVRKSRKSPLQIECEESLDISAAQDLHKKLKKALSEERPIVVNASKVERVDTSILQMFYALSKTAKKQQLALTWQAPSQKFQDAARLLDLEDGLELLEA